jgi:hypothetical protein
MRKLRSPERIEITAPGYRLNIIGADVCTNADGQCRTEIFGCEQVVLAEGPIAGRATVMRHARGVLLRRAEAPGDDRPWFEIAVLFDDGGEPIELHRVCDDAAVIAQWRRAGLDLGLPLLIQGEDGCLVEPFDQIGHVRLGSQHDRRIRRVPATRRPRFLMRRKTGRFPDRPIVRREREIIARS